MRAAQDWLACPPEDLTLSLEDVHVWCVTLDLQRSQLKRLRQTLATDERKRAERFVSHKHRLRFIAARGMLRTILGRYVNVDPGLLRFSYSRYGKPSLASSAGQEMLRFNLSHSHEIALLAITRSRAIGVDLERIRFDYPFEQVADRFFAPDESATLRSLPDKTKPEAFFMCWTRKEAFIKARGEGLSHSLKQFSVSLIPGDPATLVGTGKDSQENSHWTLEDVSPGSGYVAALAVEGDNCRLSKFSTDVQSAVGYSERA